MSEVLAVLLDVSVLVLLGVMIFYSVRLYSGLKVFRDSRSDLSRLISELTGSITQADQAISGLQAAAKASGRELQELINQSRAISEELQFINEAGDNLARRLEELAEKSGKRTVRRNDNNENAPGEEDAYFSDPELEKIFRRPGKAKSEANGDVPASPFAIRDRDFDLGEPAGEISADTFLGVDEDGEADALHTRAERDLYEAMLGKRKKK